MKLLGLHFLALFIALTSIAFEVPTYEFCNKQITQIQTNDIWESDSLSVVRQTHFGEGNVIAQEFVPLILISDHSQPAPIFDYYISIYDQNQVKDYYLRI